MASAKMTHSLKKYKSIYMLMVGGNNRDLSDARGN